MSSWDILSFSDRLDWFRDVTRGRQHLMMRFAQHRKVLNFAPPWDWRQAYRYPTRLYKIQDNLWHFEWGRLFPFFRRPLLAVHATVFLRAIAVRWLCARLGIGEHIYLVWYPGQVPVVTALPPRFTVYYAFDKFDAWHHLKESWREETVLRETMLAKIAHIGFGVSDVISEGLRARGLQRVYTIPNGVVYEKFARQGSPREPEDIADVPHPRLGYVGGLSEYTAFCMLSEIAAMRSNWHIVLIGAVRGMTDDQRSALQQLLSLPNVHHLGARPFEHIQDYIHALDVGLAAFEGQRGGGFGVSSLKIYEYLSAGLPVVATPIDDVTRMGDMVYIARTSAEWVAQIERALREDSSELRRRRQEFAKQHSWDNRAKQVMEIVEEAYREWKGGRQ